jgi:hypothetical protein
VVYPSIIRYKLLVKYYSIMNTFSLAMSANTEEIFVSLKKNGFDISLLELEKILALLVKEDFIRTEISSGSRG